MEKIKEAKEESVEFVKDVETEAKRITWPSRNETIRSTIVVVVITVIFASFLGFVDYIFSIIVRLILG